MTWSRVSKLCTRERSANAILFFALLAALFKFTHSSKPEFYPDTNTYLVFADQIRSGDLIKSKPLWAIPSETLSRTPGFPLLLAIWQAIVGSTDTDLLFLHFIIGTFTLLSVPYLLRDTLPPWMSLILLAGLFHFSAQAYFTPILTEWSALNSLLILCSLAVRFLQTPRMALLIPAGLLAAFAVLIRPALLPALFLPIALALSVPERPKRMLLIALIVTLMPIASWMAFNYYRANTFTLASLSGTNLFGAATLIGSASTLNEDSPLFRQFIEAVNQGKEPQNSAALPISTFFSPTFPLIYFHDHNIWQVGFNAYKRAVFDAMVVRFGKATGADSADDIPPGAINPELYFPQIAGGILEQPQNQFLKTSLTAIGMNDMFEKYAWRVISHEPSRSAQFLIFNLQPLVWIVPWALLIIAAFWIPAPFCQNAATVTALFLLLHVFHSILIAVITLLVPRYSNLTLLPFSFLSLILVGEAGLQALRQRSRTLS